MNTESDTTKAGKQLKYLLVILLLFLGSGIGNVFFMLDRQNLRIEKDRALLHADSSLSVKLQVEKHLNETQTALNAKIAELNKTLGEIKKDNENLKKKQVLSKDMK